jgi:hypothetical protein
MPISRITIENFKGVGERFEISIRPITLLFGANSAGKSTILQALLYLRELLERKNADADRLLASGAAIDLGGFRQFVHGHDLGRAVTVGVSLTVDADGLSRYPLMFPDPAEAEAALAHGPLPGVDEVSVAVTVRWDRSSRMPWIRKYAVGINGRLDGGVDSLGHPSSCASCSGRY